MGVIFRRGSQRSATVTMDDMPLFCVGIGLGFGIKENFTNILLAACMVVAAVSSIILFRWWRAEDLDPKFRLLLLLLVIQTLLIGVSLNLNIWVKRCNKLSLSDECLTQDWSQFGIKKPMYVKSLATGQRLPGSPPPGCFNQCNQGYAHNFYASQPQFCYQLTNSTSK